MTDHLDRELALRPTEAGLKPVNYDLFAHLPKSIERPETLSEAERRECSECSRVHWFPAWLPGDGFCRDCERLVNWEAI